MSELNDHRRIGSAPETPQIGAHHEPEALPAYHEEPPEASPVPDETVTDARHGIMGAGSAAILLLATIIVAGLLLIATHGGRTEYGNTGDGTAFYMGPTAVQTPGSPYVPQAPQVASIYATSPQAAASAIKASTGSATTATDGKVIPVIVYLFKYDSNNVPENEELTALAADLSASGREVAIVAYTDPRGSAGYNQRLSERRAKAIGDYLAAHGVDRANITTSGAGATNAYSTNALDRRAVITPQ